MTSSMWASRVPPSSPLRARPGVKCGRAHLLRIAQMWRRNSRVAEVGSGVVQTCHGRSTGCSRDAVAETRSPEASCSRDRFLVHQRDAEPFARGGDRGARGAQGEQRRRGLQPGQQRQRGVAGARADPVSNQVVVSGSPTQAGASDHEQSVRAPGARSRSPDPRGGRPASDDVDGVVGGAGEQLVRGGAPTATARHADGLAANEAISAREHVLTRRRDRADPQPPPVGIVHRARRLGEQPEQPAHISGEDLARVGRHDATAGLAEQRWCPTRLPTRRSRPTPPVASRAASRPRRRTLPVSYDGQEGLQPAPGGGGGQVGAGEHRSTMS